MNVHLRRLIIGLSTMLLLIAFSVSAATVADRLSGSWEAEVTGDGKTFSFIFEFRARGNALSGTVELPSQDRSFDIRDGKINGYGISFEAFGIWTGTLEGDQLTLTRELDYGKKQHMKAHRKRGQ
ncbi:MAG TPA: hypothetical protein VNN08_18735 [Thermoanaerobaculia bacterium]|nr:hypothetical protein [Thermoanaerobaculia bacterium]